MASLYFMALLIRLISQYASLRLICKPLALTDPKLYLQSFEPPGTVLDQEAACHRSAVKLSVVSTGMSR